MPVRIRPYTDLHFDFHGDRPDKAPPGKASGFFDSFVPPHDDEFDAISVTGDIGNPAMSFIEHIARHLVRPGKVTAYSMGNHCGYRGLTGSRWESTFWEEQEALLAEFCAQNGIHFLNRSSVIFQTADGDNVRMSGCVGWPEIAAELVPTNMTRRDAMEYSQKGWSAERGFFQRYPHNDFREIRSGAGNSRHRFTPSQMIAWHKLDLAFLQNELTPFDGISIVNTHVGPASAVKPGDHAWLYGSRAIEDAIVNAGCVSMWQHGHTHVSADYELDGGVRVVSNARGYPGDNPSFDPRLIVEVGPTYVPRLGM